VNEEVDKTAPIIFTHSSSVPNYSTITYLKKLNLEKNPTQFSLVRFKADDWGQVWVNGEKVYQTPNGSHRFGDGDWRYASIGARYSSTNPCPSDFTSMCFKYANGEVFPFSDHVGDSSHDFHPNLDITSYLRVGENTIEIACVNAYKYGDCIVNITGYSSNPDFRGLWSNQCLEFEKRTKN
jgi:hypothetical protein